MFLKWIVKLFIALNSNVSKGQLAAGIASGFFLALLPAGNLLWVVLFVLVLCSKANSAMILVVTGVGKLLSPLWASGLDTLGWAILNMPTLRDFFIRISNLPIAPLTRFNNTIVMGGLLTGLLLWLPIFLISIGLVELYRRKLSTKIAQLRFVKWIYRLPLVNSLAKAVSAAARVVN